MQAITWLADSDPPARLPPTDQALADPNGLLAAGGALTPDWLLYAYGRGIFPWYGPGQPILWWTPEPRAVLLPPEFRVSRSLARSIRNRGYRTTVDAAFREVVAGCAAPRRDRGGTWLSPAMQAAYVELHERGHAHSIETWQDKRLVGGIYGVTLGRVFFGESMFSRARDASKVALARLVAECRRLAVPLIDCQVPSAHLASLGSRCLPRAEFEVRLAGLVAEPQPAWRQ